MGRSAHHFLAGALGFYPFAKVRDAATLAPYGPRWHYPLQSGEPRVPFAAGTTHYGKYMNYKHSNGWPFDALPTGRDLNRARFIGSPNLMGYTWSAELITEVTDTTIRMRSKNDGAGQEATDTAVTDVAAGTNPTGIVKGALITGDSEANGVILSVQNADGAGETKLSTLGKFGFALQADALDAGDVINGLCGNTFGCPSTIANTSGAVVYAIGGNKNVGTHTWGVTIGAMTTFVMHDISLANSQSATVVRKFRAPFAMRILKVTFGSAGSGASNTVSLQNATQGTAIVTAVALASAGSISIEPDAGSFQNANRNIAFDDVIDLVATTSGTGYTNLWCMVTCTVKGNAYAGTDNARTWGYYHGTSDANITQVEGESFTQGPTKHYSGPVIGNPISLYIGGKDSSASATDEAQQSIAAPFDMEVFHVAVFSHSCDTGSAATTKVRNITQGVDVIAHIDASNDPSPGDDNQGNSTFTIANPIIKRGDVLSVDTTTTGVITTFAGAVILGIARGFPYANAALD